MKNCYDLNLNFSPFKKEFVLPEPTDTKSYYAYGPETLSDELKSWAKENRITPELALIFVHPPYPNSYKTVHLDSKIGDRFVREYSINWNYGSDNILMEWWTCDSPGIQEGKESHPYIAYNEKDCVKIEESTSTGPVLFRNSRPHSIINLGTIPRYGISVRFKNNYPWKYITEHLKKYIKED